jgi:uncharacterized protein (DUF2384 family)
VVSDELTDRQRTLLISTLSLSCSPLPVTVLDAIDSGFSLPVGELGERERLQSSATRRRAKWNEEEETNRESPLGTVKRCKKERKRERERER